MSTLTNNDQLCIKLINAVMYGDKHVFDNLLKLPQIKNFINLRSNLINTPARVTALEMSANIGNNYFILSLIKAGADVNSKDSDKNTALNWASLNGHTESVKILLSNNAALTANCVGTNAIHDAAKNGHLETIKLLTTNFLALIDIPNGYGNTAFMRACMHNRFDVVKYLLKNHITDIKLNHVNNNGFTAKDIAEGLGNDKIVDLLDNYNAMNSKDWNIKKNSTEKDALLEKQGWKSFLATRRAEDKPLLSKL